MNRRIFLYGTLRDPALYAVVAGAALAGRPARLADHAVTWAEGESFPLIVERVGSVAEGLVVEVSDDTRARLDFYELGFGYSLKAVETDCGGDMLPAKVYFPDDGLWKPGAPWSLADWQGRFGALTREAAEEYMRLMGVTPADIAARGFPQIRMRAASRLRAKGRSTPEVMSPEMRMSDLRIEATRQPYTDYFGVREDDLSFPTFAGGQSQTVTRASFMGGDAVTVLPYDAKLDCVLVIRQFRHGVFVRGDGNPWLIEPAAGRIDPGETPEETALRELREETGATAERLIRVAEYYPSPSAYSEYIFSYVALADLSGQDGTTSGLDSEHEDIMSHVVAFDRLMELIETGAANTAPLVLSAMWLARNRDSLRASD